MDHVEVTQVIERIMDRLLCDRDIWIPGKHNAGAILFHLSAQFYLDLEDFRWVAKILECLCERVRRGKWRSPLGKVILCSTQCQMKLVSVY